MASIEADVELSPELVSALERDAAASELFTALPPSHRREYMAYVAEAKRPETRQRRADRCVEMLHEHQTNLRR